jgi:hypothetical protein
MSDSSFAAPMVAESVALSPATTTIDFSPLPGYDAQATTSAAAGAAVDSQFFKSENGAQYQTSDKVPAVAADRPILNTGESPRINVAPATAENAGKADILVGKDGTVSLAEGLAGKTLKEYNVQVEAGADAKLAEKALTDRPNDQESVTRCSATSKCIERREWSRSDFVRFQRFI